MDPEKQPKLSKVYLVRLCLDINPKKSYAHCVAYKFTDFLFLALYRLSQLHNNVFNPTSIRRWSLLAHCERLRWRDKAQIILQKFEQKFEEKIGPMRADIAAIKSDVNLLKDMMIECIKF